MVPELVGRFPVLVPFHSLSKADLVRVLSEPRNSLVAQKKHEFSMDGVMKTHLKKIALQVELEFTPEAMEEIAQIALERPTGARALR